MNASVDASRPSIDSAGHRLHVTIPDVPLILDADHTRLSQVITNLLNNACKFTESGGDISLTVEPRPREVEIRVRDTGIGIAPEMRPHLFEMFVQPQDPVTRTHGGLGIGLSLVRTLAEMHGGSVEAHSDGQGRGSEFVVRLPLATESMRSAGTRESAAQNDDRAHRRVLVVDDNRDAARTLACALSSLGHECRPVFDGVGALATAADFLPEVFVLDIGMPGMSGYELAGRLRADPRFQSSTLIALTGWGQDEDLERSRVAGFDHHLVKPVAADTLSELISQCTAANGAASTSDGASAP